MGACEQDQLWEAGRACLGVTAVGRPSQVSLGSRKDPEPGPEDPGKPGKELTELV